MAKIKVNANMIFQRYEKKYLLTEWQYEALMSALIPHAYTDEYGLHTISSVYYDTDDYAVIRKSLDKPNFKEKLRLRSYGAVGKDDTVYIELKKKFSGVTYKRRMALPLKSATAYLDRGIIPAESKTNLQTFGEIEWFVEKYAPTAKVILSYDRIAMIGREDSELRITIDSAVRWRDYQLDLSKGSSGILLRPSSVRLMEVKIPQALPIWFCDVLSELEIYPQSFSKYGKVYTENLMYPRHEQNTKTRKAINDSL